MIIMESEKMDIGYRDTTHLGIHYLLHRFFFFWPENVPQMQIQNLDDFFVFCFFYLYPGLYSVKKNLYCTFLKRLFSRSSLTSLRYWITEHRLLGSTLYFSPWHFWFHVLLNSCTDETNGNRKCSSRDEHQTSVTVSFATNYVNSRNRSFSTKQCDSKSK